MFNGLKSYYLHAMELDRWLRRTPLPTAKLEEVKRRVASCSSCILHKTRTQTVFARGNPTAKLMIIGEAPGFHEDKQGLPFVGKAGQLLNLMLHSIGLKEKEVYIANVLKCRPPHNRDPQPEEIRSCSAYLDEQINLIHPKLIFALGRFSGQFLSKEVLPLNRLRGRVHYYGEFPFIVSYHPAYLLRNPIDKKKAYVDLLTVKHYLDRL